MLGNYPLGTLLVLDTGELGLVIGHPESGSLAPPRVQLLKKSDEGYLVHGDVVELDETDARTGAPKRGGLVLGVGRRRVGSVERRRSYEGAANLQGAPKHSSEHP